MQLLLGCPQATANLAVFTRCNKVQVLVREIDGEVESGRSRVELVQLQHDALGKRTGADTRRVEFLHLAQRRLDFLDLNIAVRLENLRNLIEVDRQVAVVVDGVDDGFADDDLARGEMLHLELPQQVFAQCLTRFVGELADRPAFTVPAAVLDVAISPGLPLVFGFDRFDLGRRLATGLGDVGEVLHLQHDVLFERVLYLRVEVENGQLQQADRLLQLWRHGECLTEF